MTADETRRCVPFLKLLYIMDDLRRRSFKETPPAQIQSMMGLTIRQGSALRETKALTEECPEGISLKVLARNLQMTMPATSLLVEAMVTKGFFVRETNPNDRRAVRIKLSQKGLRLFDDVFFKLQTDLDKLAACLSPEEMETIAKAADKMHAAQYA